jgi:amino-acid N-acetyltransferase
MNVDVDVERASAADVHAIARLLVAADLPADGVREALEGFVVVRHGSDVIAAAGVERYDAAVLLRSVVVAPQARGHGLGARVVRDRLERAAGDGAADVYLLTTTAEAFFARLGFRTVARAAVPAGVRGSAEFTSLCPDSATAMHRTLSTGA